MVDIDTAREWLRITETANDPIITGLLEAAPDYIHVTTGMDAERQKTEPLADTVTKFLLLLWFDAQQSEAERLQRVIDNLLKTLTARARETKKICTVINLDDD